MGSGSRLGFGAGCSLGLKAAGLSACLHEDEASAASPGGGVGGGPQRGLCQPGRRAQQEIKDAVRHGAAAQVPDLVSTCGDPRLRGLAGCSLPGGKERRRLPAASGRLCPRSPARGPRQPPECRAGAAGLAEAAGLRIAARPEPGPAGLCGGARRTRGGARRS